MATMRQWWTRAKQSLKRTPEYVDGRNQPRELEFEPGPLRVFRDEAGKYVMVGGSPKERAMQGWKLRLMNEE